MKALSIREPWATYIREGIKTIETRSWKTKHRGPILLCASKTPKSHISGKAFAVATLADCRPMTNRDEELAVCENYPGAYSWVLEDIRPIEPFRVKGQLGLYGVDYEI